MSTATQTPNVNGVTEQAVSYENYGLARVYIGEGEAQKIEFVPEEQGKEKLAQYEKDKADGKDPQLVQVEFQTFRLPYAGSEEGMVQLVPDAKERVLLFNRGLSTKLQNKSRSLLKATDEDNNWQLDVTTDALDMTQYAAAPTSRRSLSTLDKIANLAKTLSPEQIAALRAMLGTEDEA